jgi:hypothetical protein
MDRRVFFLLPFGHLNVKRILTAITVVAALLMANRAHAQSPARLQALVNDTVAQLQIAYRHNVPEQRRRYAQLAAAITVWRVAPRSETNNRLLEDWLRVAIRNSMPGSQAPLPPVPPFEQEAVSVDPPTAAPPSVTERQADSDVTTGSVSADTTQPADSEQDLGDPFVDDPVQVE